MQEDLSSSLNSIDWLSESRLKHDDDFRHNYFFKHENRSGGIVIKFANKWKENDKYHDTKDYVVGKSSKDAYAVVGSSNPTIFTVEPS